MTSITSDQIKTLREQTGISVMQCKKALEEAAGDMTKALELLKKKGAEIAAKKSDRELAAGVVASYIHSDNKLGVLLELQCETDFVARNEEFKTLADDIALHIAAMSPRYISEAHISSDEMVAIKEKCQRDVEGLDKPAEMKEKIIEGKVASYTREASLLNQSFVKDPEKTIQDLIQAATQKMGEKIEIARFVRYALLG